MANICDQSLYIVAETDDDMDDLLTMMVENFEKVTRTDLLVNASNMVDWQARANAMQEGSSDYNMLCFLSDEPDSRAESGYFRYGIVEGRPFVILEMGLKWGPSYQPKTFCNGLDASRYGFACINGGEYMCAMGDEIAYVQYGEKLGDPFDGGLDYEEYVKQSAEVRSKQPTTLSELAHRLLFACESASTYFWEIAYDEDGCDDDDHANCFDDSYYDDRGYGNDPGYDSGLQYSYGYAGASATYGYGPPSFNWKNPSERELKRIYDEIPAIMGLLPLCLSCSLDENDDDKPWTLMAGDRVVISVESWQKKNLFKMSMRVGGESCALSDFTSVLSDLDEGLIVCMLPFIRCSIAEFEPGASFKVRLELAEFDLTAITEYVQEFVAKDPSGRSHSSASWEVA